MTIVLSSGFILAPLYSVSSMKTKISFSWISVANTYCRYQHIHIIHFTFGQDPFETTILFTAIINSNDFQNLLFTLLQRQKNNYCLKVLNFNALI